jgi:hypothetical protein
MRTRAGANTGVDEVHTAPANDCYLDANEVGVSPNLSRTIRNEQTTVTDDGVAVTVVARSTSHFTECTVFDERVATRGAIDLAWHEPNRTAPGVRHLNGPGDSAKENRSCIGLRTVSIRATAAFPTLEHTAVRVACLKASSPSAACSSITARANNLTDAVAPELDSRAATQQGKAC